NNFIDERNSPVKASHIAAKLLKLNYKALGSWPLAITAYNNGIGNIRKAMKRAKSRDLGVIIAKNHTGAFKFASSNFYPCFLAALHAEKYHQEIFSFKPVSKAEALQKVKYKLKHSWHPKTLARRANIQLQTLLSYNLDLKKSIHNNHRLPRGLIILVPPEKADELKAKFF
ncbi:MAG: transglycosylase SLT domain-containing protein, partial [Bdellovibrionales bacterium]|nr:transglycosylase SLT domain-containing protein [Bdellovibrionales bacterium]